LFKIEQVNSCHRWLVRDRRIAPKAPLAAAEALFAAVRRETVAGWHLCC
jgi:hypothetical protein